MPVSSNFGKSYISDIVNLIKPKIAIDIGCGCGTYAKMFPEFIWTGIEIWPSYVEDFGLSELYKELFVADARAFQFTEKYDIAFAGDVLEHLPLEDAINLLLRLRDCADTVVVSIPIGYHPQGDWGGNPYETHITDDWTVEKFFDAFGFPSAYCVDGEIGVFVYSNKAELFREMNVIPKTIHIVWIGDESKRPDDCIQTWRDKNPDWTVKVWGNEEFKSCKWINLDHMLAVWDTQPFGVADMMRYEILYKEGGFCIDADSVCEKPLEDLFSGGKTVLFYENEIERPGLVANGYMASAPKNPFFLRIIEDIKNDPTVPSAHACIATGPFRLTDSLKKFSPHGVIILPSYFFMPEHHTGRKHPDESQVYGRQFWGSTKNSYGGNLLTGSINRQRLKIVVYAISKNEEQFVETFCSSARDADLILIADTGSTDGTVEKARQLGATVHDICITPWRFDFARNAALALIPRDFDVCISLDLDERLEPGWRTEIERIWEKGKTTRMRYVFDWSNGIRFQSEKIHARSGYHWHHPCHEYIRPDSRIEEVWAVTNFLLVTHHPDPTKSRGQYMDLLAMSVKEDPHCPRNAFYYARELTFYNKAQEGIDALMRYLELPEAVWPEERSYAMRLLSKCHQFLGNLPAAEKWLYLATAESPDTREPWCDMAMFMYQHQRWEECFAAASKALKIVNRPYSYISDPTNWGPLPHDLLSVSAWNLGLKELALKHAKICVELAPDDPRLKGNLDLLLKEAA